MKIKGVTLFSGVVVTVAASVGLWQLLVVALLMHGIEELIVAFGRLL
jgi:hypothetical protein